MITVEYRALQHLGDDAHVDFVHHLPAGGTIHDSTVPSGFRSSVRSAPSYPMCRWSVRALLHDVQYTCW